MTGVCANNTQNTLPLDDATITTKTFNRWPDFHGTKKGGVMVTREELNRFSGLVEMTPRRLLGAGMECVLQIFALATGVFLNIRFLVKFFLSSGVSASLSD